MSQSGNIVIWENKSNLPAVIDTNGLVAYFEKIKSLGIVVGRR